jgi:hypothetical protein
MELVIDPRDVQIKLHSNENHNIWATFNVESDKHTLPSIHRYRFPKNRIISVSSIFLQLIQSVNS